MYQPIARMTALIGVVLLGATFQGCSHTSAIDSVTDKRISGHVVLKEFSTILDKDGKPIWLGGPESILQDASGAFWISAPPGVYLYDERENQWTKFADEDKLGSLLWPQFYQSLDNTIWFRSKVTGLVKYVEGTALQENRKLGSHTVQAVFSGTSGKLWFVLEDEMLYYQDRKWSQSIRLPERARVLTQTPGETEETLPAAVKQLIEKYSSDRKVEGVASKLNLSTIKTGLEDRNGSVWLGGLRGVFRLDPARMEWKFVATPATLQPVYLIFEDRKGGLWFSGMSREVSWYDKNTDNLHALKLPDVAHSRPSFWNPFSISALYQDRDGRMMFGTSEGLITFLQDQEKSEVFDEYNSPLQSRDITVITEDRQGRIWIGTAGGIFVLKPYM